jgi:hypothetical protein
VATDGSESAKSVLFVAPSGYDDALAAHKSCLLIIETWWKPAGAA